MIGLEARLANQLVGGALCAALAGCGGGGSTTPTAVATPTPAPCTQTVIESAEGAIPAHALAAIGFSTTVAGRVDVTVDWTLATSPIGVYIVPASPACDIASFNARSCTFLALSEPVPVKPRKISANSTAGGNYQLLVANFGDTDESASGQVVLSVGSCAAFGAGPLPAVQQRPALTMSAVGRLR